MAKTYIIDGNSLLFRAFYALFRPGQEVMKSSSGVPTNALYGYRNMMKKIKSELTYGDKMIVCFDTGRKSFRTEKLASYKMNRKPVEPQLVEQMPLARILLDCMGIFHCEKDGYEGDDLAGSLAKYAYSKGDEVTLFTSDKDFLQLLEGDIKINFLRKGLSEIQVFTKDNIHSILGYQANQVVDYKGLVGDTSDNIPGIKGVGEKTACKLLDQYPHLEEIFEGIKNDKSKVSQNIIAQKDQALFCREIATIITDVDVKDFYSQGDFKDINAKDLLDFYKLYDLKKFAFELEKEIQNKNAFDFKKDEPKTKLVYIPYKEIKSMSELNYKPNTLLVINSNSNFHLGEVEGFFLSDGKNNSFISINAAKSDNKFVEFLTSSEEKNTFDLKGLEVCLNKVNLPRSKNFKFDLLLASYLLSNEIGNKKEDIFKYFDLDYSSLSDIDKEAYLTQIIPTYKEEVISSLKENNQYDLYKDVELPLTIVLANMEIEGFPCSKEVLSKIDSQFQEKLASITSAIYSLIGKEINLNSPRQVGNLIYDELKLRRKGKANSTDITVLESIKDRHPVVPLIIEYRKYQKLVSSYTSSLNEYIHEDGKIHGIYNQALTSTGRLSMSEPNLQNISMRDEEGKEIRKAFFYKDGEYQFLSLDYSQIELRMLASIASIQDLIDVFNNDEDIHTSTASKVFNVPKEEVTSLMRRKAKAVNFGIVYGITPWGLSDQIKVSPIEATEIINSFYDGYKGLKEFEEKTISEAHSSGYVTTLLNRRRYLPGINSDNHNVRSFSERAAVNAVVQGSAADLIKVAMIKVDELLKNYKTKMILQIHDELIFKVPEEEVGIIDSKIEKAMEEAVKLKCKLVAEGSYGPTWYDCK